MMQAYNTFSSMVEQVATMIPVVEEFDVPALLASLKRCHMHLASLTNVKVPERSAVAEAAHEVLVALEGFRNAEGVVAEDRERLAQVWVGLHLMSEKPVSI